MTGGAIVLAGGHELRPGCEPMDRRVLLAAGGPAARVVFLPTAVARFDPVGSGRGAVAYFARLGARCDVAMILNRADADRPEMAALIESGTLIYLGGGEPHVLLEALRGSLAWQATLRAFARGAVVGGSSAGAMVVCDRTLLPNLAATPDGPPWREGLGLVPNTLVLPHYSSARAETATGLARRLASALVLGIPEQSAVLGGASGAWEVAGPGPVTVFGGGEQHAYGSGESFPAAPAGAGP
jgi:cyanophycinase